MTIIKYAARQSYIIFVKEQFFHVRSIRNLAIFAARIQYALQHKNKEKLFTDVCQHYLCLVIDCLFYKKQLHNRLGLETNE